MQTNVARPKCVLNVKCACVLLDKHTHEDEFVQRAEELWP